MAVLEVPSPTAAGDQDRQNEGTETSYSPFEADPTPLELAHLLAELNFLRAQLTVLRSVLTPHSDNSTFDQNGAQFSADD